jgi:hypothetical protein
MTYCRDNVDIAITIERNGVHEKDGEGGEVILPEPFGA